MKQDATERPEPTLFRKASIAGGGAFDHSGRVKIVPIENFDLDRTIFKTLEGALPRMVMTTRVAREPHWNDEARQQVERAYTEKFAAKPLPEIPSDILQFMVQECDFDVEHADGSFLDHLYFGFEYSVHHYNQYSPLVMLLHSILGTGTNTFAMTADKIPALRKLLSDFEWTHIEAFPSVLRLLYDVALREELRDNVGRIADLESIRFHRVIDNEAIEISSEDLWIQLNFQLIHLIDFLPVANWGTHANETSFILFRDLYNLLAGCGKLEAHVAYSPTQSGRSLTGEPRSLANILTTLIPVGLSEKMATRSVKKFSDRIGHSLAYQLSWK